MTLKELLSSCDFKGVAHEILQIFPKQKSSLSHYKEVFDFLRHMKPETEPDNPEGIIEICLWSGHESLSGEGKGQIIVAYCEGDYWKYNLSKKIIVSDGLTMSNNEIVARCMWSLTFYGDQRTRKKVRDDILGKIDTSNPYTVAADKLRSKLFHNYLPKQYKNSRAIPLELESRACRNRSKRMRDHRQVQRIKVLERMARVEDAIRRLTVDTQPFYREEVNYLFDTKLIYEDTYQSYSYDVSQRVEYLIDLLSNYVFDNFSPYTQYLLMFRTSSYNPLTQDERDRIKCFFDCYLPSSAEIRYGYGKDEDLDIEVSLLFMGSY